MPQNNTTPKINPLDFVLAGNATFTLQSRRTGTRFTYRVRKPSEDTPHFVQLLCGPDNTSSFRFFATIFKGIKLCHGRRTDISAEAPSAKAFKWFWERLLETRQTHKDLDFFHAGKCCRCGRKLTVPESVINGYGPECATKIKI